MKFTYYLRSDAGWAGFRIDHRDIHLNYRISYCIGDSLKELLGGLIAFADYNSHLKIFHDILEDYLDENEDHFEWKINEEGSEIYFLFDKTDKDGIINLRVVENYGNYENCVKQECVFNEDIVLDELINDIISSCKEMLKKYGILGYWVNFWREFPMSYFLVLSDYINERIKYDSVKEIIGENEEELFFTDIQEEIKYIPKFRN